MLFKLILTEEQENIRRVAIQHVTDLDVHGPIGADEHVARGSFDEGIDHFCCFLTKFLLTLGISDGDRNLISRVVSPSFFQRDHDNSRE